MRITGNAVLNAPADRVWAALNDPDVLARTIPGCERLEESGPDRYRMTVTAGVASIKGTYQGDVALADPVPPDSFTLRASGAGAPGTVRADVRITLACPDGATTTVSYDADALVGGPVGGVGQRVISAVARRTAAQFFSAVSGELSGELSDGLPGAGAGSSAAERSVGVGPVGSADTAAAVGSGTAGEAAATATGRFGAARTDQPESGAVAGAWPGSSGPQRFPFSAGRPPADVASLLLGASIALAGVLVGRLAGRRR